MVVINYLRGNVIKACGTNQVCCQFEIPMAGNLLEDFFTIPKCGLKGTDTKPRTQSRILVDLADDIEEQEAIPSEFPWMILVLKKQKNGLHARHCGGSLIRADGEFTKNKVYIKLKLCISYLQLYFQWF